MDPRCLGKVRVGVILTRDAIILQSSHQNGAAEIFLANSRATTAIVAATTLKTVASHTFHARLSSGGKDIEVTVLVKISNRREGEMIDCNDR